MTFNTVAFFTLSTIGSLLGQLLPYFRIILELSNAAGFFVEVGPYMLRFSRSSGLGIACRLGFGLSPELWLVQLGIFLNMFGYGAVLPFEVIYLHNGHGFSLSVAGLVVGTITGVAVVTVPIAGPLIDRFGARATTVGGGVALAAGYAGLAFAHAPAVAFVAAALAGTGNGILNPSQSTLLTSLASSEVRHRSTAFSRVAGNAGIGIGGALGGLVAAYGLKGSSRCS